MRTNSLDLTPGPLRVFKSGSELFGVARTTGVITAAPRAKSGIGMYINGSTVTSGDVLRLKTVDATLNGGKFFNCVNTANSSVFSIAEGGNTVIAGTLAVTGATTLTGAAQFDSTITSGKSGSNGGLTVKATGGGTTFSVAGATGNTTVEGDLLVRAGKLKIGAGAGTAVTATAAELNKLAGTSANVTQANLDALTGAGETALHSHAVPATVVQNKRQRVAIGDVNTGATILPAIEGKAYRIIDIALVAYGGNLAATADATGVAVSGTQSAAAAALFTVPVASLTQSTLIHSSCAGSTAFLLADGASFVACDDNTAVTVQAVGGSDLIAATGIDVIITYVLE